MGSSHGLCATHYEQAELRRIGRQNTDCVLCAQRAVHFPAERHEGTDRDLVGNGPRSQATVAGLLPLETNTNVDVERLKYIRLCADLWPTATEASAVGLQVASQGSYEGVVELCGCLLGQ